MEVFVVLSGFEHEKTKPIISYCVLRKESQGLRDAYCENEFEKTKPIPKRPK